MGNLLRGSEIMDEDLILLIEKILEKNEKRISRIVSRKNLTEIVL